MSCFDALSNSSLRLLGLACAFCLSNLPAQAASNRVWVSGRGADSATCGATTAPCRSFKTAYANVTSGGVIAVLDSGDFGPLTIAKPVSVVNDGAGTALVVQDAANQYAITVNVPAGGDVLLRGLTLDGVGVGLVGVVFLGGRSLHVEKCAVRKFASSGIALAPRTDATIVVSDTIIENNGGHGAYLQPVSNSARLLVRATFAHVEAYENALNGIGIYSNFIAVDFAQVHASIIDSISNRNGANGYFAYSANDEAFTQINLLRSAAQFNKNYGVSIEGRRTIGSVTQNALTHNGDSLSSNWVASLGAQFRTYDDNATGGFDATVAQHHIKK